MSYIQIANEKLEQLKGRDDIVILAIESSCDETACAIMKGKQLLSNVVATQIEIHRRFGGVVPEIASRKHTCAISLVVREALEKANMTFDDIDVIAVTKGPGLVGALLVGVIQQFAKLKGLMKLKLLVAQLMMLVERLLTKLQDVWGCHIQVVWKLKS